MLEGKCRTSYWHAGQPRKYIRQRDVRIVAGVDFAIGPSRFALRAPSELAKHIARPETCAEVVSARQPLGRAGRLTRASKLARGCITRRSKAPSDIVGTPLRQLIQLPLFG